MTYVAIINVPGDLGMDDDPPTFDHAHEAWSYLASERERGEDAAWDALASEGTGVDENYSDTHETLAVLGESAHWRNGDDLAGWLASHGIDPDGTGTVYGARPGYDGDHDLGLAYSVGIAED